MTWIYAIDLIGTLVFAISGVLVGLDKKFDIVGVGILGLVTAVGGALFAVKPGVKGRRVDLFNTK